MTTRRNRRVQPRPRVYEPNLRSHDTNTATAREPLVFPGKGKRLRILRVRAIQEVADGRRLYEVYFGKGRRHSRRPGKGGGHAGHPRAGRGLDARLSPRRGPRGLRDEPLSGRWGSTPPVTAHKIIVEYTEES